MKTKTQSVSLLISSAILPFIPMLFLYNKNNDYLDLGQILLVSLIISVCFVLFFDLMAFIFKSSSSSFVICVFLTFILFSFNSIYNKFILIQELFEVRLRYIAIVTFIIVVLVVIFIGYIIKKVDERIVSVVALVMTSTLLIFNIIPTFIDFISLSETNAKRNDFLYMKEFKINEKADSPNVYWFLCDGMLGLDAMNQLYGSFSELPDNLERRGFMINRSASIETAHTTMIAIAALMCPHYYDMALVDSLSDHDSAMALRESSWFSSAEFHYALENNELIAAFSNKGYETYTIGLSGWYFYPTTDRYYVVTHHNSPTSETLNTVPYMIESNTSSTDYQDQAKLLAILLAGSTGEWFCDLLYSKEVEKVSLKHKFNNAKEVLLGSKDASQYYLPLVNSLYDSVNSDSKGLPRLTVIHDLMAHPPFCFDKNGNITEGDSSNVSYEAHYTYAARVLVNMIDMIIKTDPNAVIILQADHGISYSPDTLQNDIANEIKNTSISVYSSVLSAIRVPIQYQTGEEKYALANPLNMSRYVINAFVGDNYEYIDH